jgi:hypothetical protein
MWRTAIWTGWPTSTVQKFACRIATAHWDESYDTLLELLNLQPLQERRTHTRLWLLYRILYKLSYFPEETFKLRNNNLMLSNRYSHQLELQVPFACTNSYFYSFVSHTSSLWNSLPKDIINLSTYLSTNYVHNSSSHYYTMDVFFSYDIM